MEFLFYTIIGIIGLFFILLILKNIFSWKNFCVLCVSVSLIWIVLLFLYLSGIFADKIIIAILMGHTSLGLFYLWEKNVREKFKIFRLPLLLIFIFIIYIILENFEFNSFLLILGLWIIFYLIYLFRNNKKFSKVAKKLIECCRNW
ncbi:MAG: hypothetical protein Q8O84_01950 [Nanoarchaeota archaeon]|nr:hypothetical protein [Nanoarchaeota archaeon]